MFAFVRGRVVALVRAATAISLLTGCGSPAALAQSAFWSTSATAGGSWGNPANWQGGTVPAGSGNAAGFVLNFNAGASVTLDGDRTIGTVISASANPWSIDPGSPAGTFTAGTVFVTGTNLNPLTVNAPMAGGNFTK